MRIVRFQNFPISWPHPEFRKLRFFVTAYRAASKIKRTHVQNSLRRVSWNSTSRFLPFSISFSVGWE